MGYQEVGQMLFSGLRAPNTRRRLRWDSLRRSFSSGQDPGKQKKGRALHLLLLWNSKWSTQSVAQSSINPQQSPERSLPQLLFNRRLMGIYRLEVGADILHFEESETIERPRRRI